MSRPITDLINQRFGKLTAISCLGIRGDFGRAYWQCKCDCGRYIEVDGYSLRKSRVSNCGWCEPTGGAYPVGNLVGRRFGTMVVVRQVPVKSARWPTSRVFEVLCDCGKLVRLRTNQLLSRKSCGGCGRWKPMVKRGLLTPVKFVKFQNGKQIWLWKCDCGNIVERSDPGSKGTKSCGCLAPKLYPTFKDAARSVMREYERSARIRGHKFALSEELFYTLITQPCHYTGLPPSRQIPTQEGTFYCGGIDRKDSMFGYFPENCVPCSGFANMAKGTRRYEEFIDLLKTIARFWSEKCRAVANENT